MTVNGATPDWLNPVPFGDVGHGQLPGNPQQWDVLSEDQLQQMRSQLLESVLAAVVQAVQGLFIPGPFGSALEQLAAWASNLPSLEVILASFTAATGLVLDQGPVEFLESLLTAITGATGIDLFDPATIFAAIQQWIEQTTLNITEVINGIFAQTGIDLGNPLSIFQAIEEFLTGLAVDIQQVLNTIGSVLGFPGLPGFDLGEIQAWIAQNVFGFIDPNRLPIIPVSHIGDTTQNLLSNPTFTDIAIYDPAGTWTLDEAVSHDTVGGSARTVCDGSVHELLSTDLIGVARDQKLDVWAWVKLDSVVATGPSAVTLGVKTFTTTDGSGNATDVVLANVQQYGTQDWVQLRATYTVPADVTTLRVRIAAEETAISGTVWFDDLWASKMGLLSMSLVEDLVGTLATLSQQIAASIDAAVSAVEQLTGLEINSGPIAFLTSLVEAVNKAFGINLASPADLIDSVAAILDGMFTTVQQVADKIGEEIGKLIKALTGIDGDTFAGVAAWAGGIADQFTAIGERITDAVNDLLERIKGLLGLDDWQLFLDSVWLALTGRPPQPTMQITPNDAADQLALLMATTAAQATTIAQLQAAIGKPVGGIVGGDDFERGDAGDLGVGWAYSDIGSGSFVVRGGQAVWRDGVGYNRAKLIRTGTPDAKTATPWQAITRVTGTVIAEVQPVVGNSGVDYLYGRVSDDHKSYIVAWTEARLINFNLKWYIYLGYNLGSGNDIELRYAEVDRPAVGVPYTLQCGDLDGDSFDQVSYRVLRGNTIVIEHTDTAGVTAPLKDNRGWGFGAAAQGALISQVTPSSLHSITVADIRSP